MGGGGGSGSAPLVTNVEWTVAEHGEDVGTLDKTWQEIYDAYPNVCVSDDGSKALIFLIGGGGESYGLVTSENDTYVIDSADGYPHTEFGD